MTSLTSRAEKLLEQAKLIDAFLENGHLPYPSHERDTLDTLPPELQRLRQEMASNTHELKTLVQGPAARGIEMCFAWTNLLTLRVISRYKIAEALDLDASMSYAAIADRIGLPESLVFRFLRNAMASNIFDETPSEQGQVRHTALSRLLATDAGFRATIGLQADELGPASSAYIEALERFGPNAQEPNQTAFSVYNDTSLSTYAYLQQHPERAKRFGDAMQWYTQNQSFDPKYVFQAFNWASLDNEGSHIVDVGGGHGHVSTFLARALAKPRFTVQDLPHVVEAATGALSDDLRSRINFQAHDFMQTQAATLNADVFIVRWILHNWSDDLAVMIVRNLVPAMKPTTKLLILEDVLDDAPMHGLTNKSRTELDIVMAAMFNGQERTRSAFRHLLAKADPRFVVDKFCRPEGSGQTLVEVSWRS